MIDTNHNTNAINTQVNLERNKHTHGGLLPIQSTNILRLISELEGSYQLLKYHAFDDDMNTLDEMKQRYYKLYFKTAKQERDTNNKH